MQQKFNVVIERDSEGWLVASVPSLHGCHTQARSFDELNSRIKEAISLCLEDDENSHLLSSWVFSRLMSGFDLVCLS